MKEQEQVIARLLPAGLKSQDRLFLEMAVADDDTEEAGRLIRDYSIEIPDGFTPLKLCQYWLTELKKAEKRHCQNVIDLQSQGKSIAGMQAEFIYEAITD